MRFDIITIFPSIFDSYFNESILKRAQEAKLIEINIHNLRDYTTDKHHKVDDTPYGGGAGMVLKVGPVYKAVEALKTRSGERRETSKISNFQFPISNEKTRTILFSAKGKKFTQQDTRRLSQYDHLILLCGRYEGVDERVTEHVADEELSIGDFVLTGGEIPAMIVLDAVARLVPGVLGNHESPLQESHSEAGVLEYPQYTKPPEFEGWKVPEVLLGGNHGEIERWRMEQARKTEG